VTRRAVALLLAVAVPAGALCAPWLHAHPDHDGDGHTTVAIHTHLEGHGSSHNRTTHPGVEEPDHERAIYLQAFVAVGVTTAAVAEVPPALFDIQTPEERPAHRTAEVTHGHDPPLAAARDSRPPPAYLS
jgi:hypothetical protein